MTVKVNAALYHWVVCNLHSHPLQSWSWAYLGKNKKRRELEEDAVREVRQDIEGHDKEVGLHSDVKRCQLVFSSEME